MLFSVVGGEGFPKSLPCLAVLVVGHLRTLVGVVVAVGHLLVPSMQEDSDVEGTYGQGSAQSWAGASARANLASSRCSSDALVLKSRIGGMVEPLKSVSWFLH
jgi:hypothetical protein